MLTDLIFVFLIAILVGSLLMFYRLWRERQLIEGSILDLQLLILMIWSQVNAKVGLEANHVVVPMTAPMVPVMAPGEQAKEV